MRRAMILVAVLATMMVIPVTAGAETTADDYVGTWTSVDIDGSNQTLTIRKVGVRFQMTLLDDGGSFCGEFAGPGPTENPTVALIARGIGTIQMDGTLRVRSYHIVCDNRVVGPSIPVTYTLLTETTMVDDTGVTGWVKT